MLHPHPTRGRRRRRWAGCQHDHHEPPTASASLGGSSPILHQVGPAAWSTTLVLVNTGVCTTSYSFALLSPTANPQPATKALVLKAGQATKATVSWQDVTLDPMPATATVEALPSLAGAPVNAPPPTPQVIQVSVQRSVSAHQQWRLELTWGLVLALIISVLTVARLVVGTPSGQRGQLWSTQIAAGSAWNLHDCWATNMGVFGGLAAALISATSSVASVFPAVPMYRFSILLVVLSGVIAIAPTVIAIRPGAPPTPPPPPAPNPLPAPNPRRRRILWPQRIPWRQPILRRQRIPWPPAPDRRPISIHRSTDRSTRSWRPTSSRCSGCAPN